MDVRRAAGGLPAHEVGLAQLVLSEARERDRVLDMGTGSGVNAIAAASRGAVVVAVDVNPVAVEAARANADRNGVGARVEVGHSDVFDSVTGLFDLIVFDPPYRWFAPRDLREMSVADEGYAALTRFFAEHDRYLAQGGRILLSFGTTGDIAYLHQLVARAELDVQELRRVDGEKDGFAVSYFAYRLTRTVREGGS